MFRPGYSGARPSPIEGPAAIEQWEPETTANYRRTTEPLAAAEEDGAIVVPCRPTGTVAPSPIDLQFVFVLDGDRIRSLAIHQRAREQVYRTTPRAQGA